METESCKVHCVPTYREDGESVYFKKISLSIEK